MSVMQMDELGWELLNHGGLLVDAPRLRELVEHAPVPLPGYVAEEWRRRFVAFHEDRARTGEWVTWVLERVCGFAPDTGTWQRGNQLGTEWSRTSLTGEVVRPRRVWRGTPAGVLPVFVDDEHPQLGKGRGRKAVSNVLQWMRASNTRLALLTNGRQWRLLHAGLDADAFCEWDAERWFEEGGLGLQVNSLRLLLQPALWTQPGADQTAPLLQAVQDSRKGQAELSALLGERVRESVELLVQAHGEQLKQQCVDVDPADIYRAAVRVVMRMVVVFFAESRDLLPRSSSLYHRAYGLNGLLEELEKHGGKDGVRLKLAYGSWPRVLALFRLVYQGSPHPALPIHAYGGELFEAGDTAGTDGLKRALAVFENACYQHQVMSDRDVRTLLERITRTKVKVRQGRSATWMLAPVDFADLSSEYIGILYEGLLDFELKTAAGGDPVIFLAVGNEPALPLSRLEAMSDAQLKSLLESMKDTSKKVDAEEEDEDEAEEEAATEAGNEVEVEATEEEADTTEDPEENAADQRNSTRTRAEEWARRVVQVAGLVKKPKGTLTPEKRAAHERDIAQKAKALVRRVVLPGEWFLVRWGGTRKGAGTFYTRPGLAVPTVHRTLRPLAYNPPTSADGTSNVDAPPQDWLPKAPEEILAVKTCDPACGSGTFPVSSLRFLADALYAAVHHHRRVLDHGDRSVVHLLGASDGTSEVAPLAQEMIPCVSDDPRFEPRLKAVLKRHVVERCIYGVDIDPLAVELCRLALWIETMDRSLPFSFLDHKIKCGNGLVGAWFDQFLHYPVMAWKNREGGDKGHTNGVHFAKDERGKKLRDFAASTLKDDLQQFLSGPTLFDSKDRAQEASAVHDHALALLNRLHKLPVHDAAERSRIYREELLGSPAYRQLKNAMDLWCACWFWPAEAIAIAPLPSTLSVPSSETIEEAERIALQKRFFHWELEFPDVFRTAGSGFDAILGNPPWDIAKPNSKEFFSNIDPLYRTYGKQDALRAQTSYFSDATVERQWLDYNADFRAQSNYMKYTAFAFGDPSKAEASGDRFGIARGKDNDVLHARWRGLRAKTSGYADALHPFRHQGSADINLYKSFLEATHALLREGGRMGLIVPSGIYSDHGTGALRRLFLDQCQWEWLFGFENRDKVFDIDSRFKFNPVIITKGGTTAVIRTTFMRRKLEDWERAEEFATPYTRAQVDQFSPRSQAILEIQSKRDLEILEKIYANSVLLGDDGPNGWGVKYSTEFHMTNDSKLFPPRTKWEEQGYRPDEYSRWLKGDWRPIAELWPELGVDPTRVTPNDVTLDDWLFDSSAGPERRTAEAKFVHGHLLKPGDVARTNARLRCAQPPYDSLPIPRANIPAGIILSRNADAWIREERIEDVALPLYQGVMFFDRSPNVAAYVSGSGHHAVWHPLETACKPIFPQFLIGHKHYERASRELKLALRSLSNSTNERTIVSALIPDLPAGHSVNFLTPSGGIDRSLRLFGCISSFVFDWVMRMKIVGTNVTWGFLSESPVPPSNSCSESFVKLAADSGLTSLASAPFRLSAPGTSSKQVACRSEGKRLGILCDSVASTTYGLNVQDLIRVLRGTDYLAANDSPKDPKGFWRVDKDKDPELRHTVLTLIAFHDLEAKIREHGGDRDKGTEAFLNQNNGEGWMLPETLRLADYGLGHDDRALDHQPVASRLGPRFYDWQLVQTAEESWRECHLHARNMLGAEEYQCLQDRIEAEKRGEVWREQLTLKESKAQLSKNEEAQQELF